MCVCVFVRACVRVCALAQRGYFRLRMRLQTDKPSDTADNTDGFPIHDCLRGRTSWGVIPLGMSVCLMTKGLLRDRSAATRGSLLPGPRVRRSERTNQLKEQVD